MSQSIGNTIKMLRKERNLTQEELAEKLNVTSQAVSKWENEAGIPDISQIIPLASVFGVSTDTVLGFERTTVVEEVVNIVTNAIAVEEYGKIETYLTAYEMMADGLKKYPNNLVLLNNCMGLGLALSLPENGWIYASERAKEIAAETIRQANLIISSSKNIDDIMRAHQSLLFLYSSVGDFDKAANEARAFPIRTDYTLNSNMARVDEYKKDYERVAADLCNDIDYSLQQLEDNAVRLGKAYFNIGNYDDAIKVYETFFDIIKAIFKNESFPPYHDFDSGDCYILLAQAYLANGETDKAIDNVERSVMYWLNLCESFEGDNIDLRAHMITPFLKETELEEYIDKAVLKEKLLIKLSASEIEPLKGNKRLKALCDKVNGTEY